MRSKWRIPALMGGLVLLAPAIGQSAVVYRMSGGGCVPPRDDYEEFSYQESEGLTVSSNGFSARASCTIPTSDSTFTPSTMTSVNVRYHIVPGTADNVAARLAFHDYDSHDYVECDEDVHTNPTSYFGLLSLQKSCSGYASNWGVMVEVYAYEMSAVDNLTVKLISVQ